MNTPDYITDSLEGLENDKNQTLDPVSGEGTSVEEKQQEELLQRAYDLLEEGDQSASLACFLTLLKQSTQEEVDEVLIMILPELCRLLYSEGSYEQLENICNYVLSIEHNGNPIAFEYLARLAIHHHEYQQAERYLSRLDSRGIAYAMVCTVLRIRKGDVKGARRALNSFYRICEEEGISIPDEPELMACEVFCLFHEGSGDIAVARGRQIWEQCEDDTVSLLLLAEVFVLVGASGEGKVLIEILQKRAPYHEQVHALASRLSFDLENFDLARRSAEKCLGMNPYNSLALQVQVSLLIQESKYVEAEQMLRQVLQQVPDALFPDDLLGDLYFSMAQYEKAKSSYARVECQSNCVRSQDRIRRARLQMIDGQYRPASLILEEIVGVSNGGDSRKAARDLVNCYYDLGEYEKAEALIERYQLQKFFSKRFQEVVAGLETFSRSW